MKKLLVIVGLFILTINAWAQTAHVDSLISIAVSRIKNNHIVINTNRDSLLNILFRTESNPQRIQIIYQIINNGNGTSKKGLLYHYKILEWARKHNDKVCESIISAELGYNYFLNGDDALATQTLHKALQMAVKTGNNTAICIAYDNLGVSTTTINLAKNYLLTALQYAKAANNKLFISYALGSLGIEYLKSNNADSAKYYALQYLEYAVKKNVTDAVAYSINVVAEVQKNDITKLKYYYLDAHVALATHDTVAIHNVYRALAIYYLHHNQPDSSLKYTRKAYNYAVNLTFKDQLIPVELFAKLFIGRNTDSALKYANMRYNLRDSAFNVAKIQSAQAIEFERQQQLQEIATQKITDENKQRLSVLVFIIAILGLLAVNFWRTNRISKKANALLHTQKEQIQATLQELKATQTQLIQSEKMASLGELTAGIAHEIQNPLNFVNNFSEVNQEMLVELEDELNKGDIEEAKAIAANIRQNEEKINHHGKRADAIVKGMLEHSRASTGQKEQTDINALADEYLRLAYHGLRAKDKTFNAELITNYNDGLPKVNIVPQDMGRVLLNLFNNAFYAVKEKQKTAGKDYKPTVEVSTFSPPSGGWGVSVRDNGNGIPEAIKDKIMQPFFTTKPTGEGTGLGLSLSYDIVVKGHGGTIKVESVEGEGTLFVVELPIN
jgi:signal transduction histidine kinase